ncbi:hypothetical protein EUBVEN_00735 [Eubacterium ventriosum ATCC 27560]|uniref:Uncharacterized protein n=1 Tax=Eubacterium ventriosum ATCC 27560 TaxID=411463 RepID=A5Z4V8_9FIRM|nr:hypothetical protein EUBVEN_00735 [Eubacterium ventriosum ATCC 27560]
MAPFFLQIRAGMVHHRFFPVLIGCRLLDCNDLAGKPCKFFRVLKLLPIFLHQIRGKVCKIFLAKTNDQKIPGHNIIDVAVIVKESSVQRQPHQLAFFIADQSHRVLIRIDRLNISAHCRLQGFQTTFDLRSIRGLARLYH